MHAIMDATNSSTGRQVRVPIVGANAWNWLSEVLLSSKDTVAYVYGVLAVES